MLVLLMWYSGRFIKGILDYIGIVLYAPSFLIVALLQGMNTAMHFTTYRTYLIVSFIFYSLVIATAQWIFYKRKKKREEIPKSSDKDRIKHS